MVQLAEITDRGGPGRGARAGRPDDIREADNGSPSERRLAEVEQRLAALEGVVRRLRQETEHVQLNLPIEISSSRK